MHDTLASDDVKVEALKKLYSHQLSKLEMSFVDMHKDLEEKNLIIKDLLEKYESVEKVINENLTIKDDLKNKDAKINGLEVKLK